MQLLLKIKFSLITCDRVTSRSAVAERPVTVKDYKKLTLGNQFFKCLSCCLKAISDSNRASLMLMVENSCGAKAPAEH